MESQVLQSNFDKPELGLRMEITGLQLREACLVKHAYWLKFSDEGQKLFDRLTCPTTMTTKLRTRKNKCRR